MSPAVLLTLLAATDAGDCVLDGDGDVELCESIYYRSRVAGLAAPSYVLWMDGTQVHHGLSWTLAVDIPTDGWFEHFNVGGDSPPGAPSRLGLAASFVWLPNFDLEARIVLRARVISIARAVHFVIAGGGSGGTLGFAPRLELRARIGHSAWGGVVVAGGFQPYLWKAQYVGDLTVGLDAPWVWWW
jgi:hypothetical protein